MQGVTNYDTLPISDVNQNQLQSKTSAHSQHLKITKVPSPKRKSRSVKKSLQQDARNSLCKLGA